MRVGAFAVLTAVSVMIAGCTSSSAGGQSPAATPSRSAAPSSAVSTPATSTPTTPPTSSAPVVPTTGPNVRPGEKPPTLPAVGEKNTAAGAITLAIYWFEALDWGYATTNSSLARTVYANRCTDCARFMQNFDLTRQAGDHFVGGRISVLSTRLAVNDARNQAQRAVDVQVRVGALQTFTRDNKFVSKAAAVADGTFRVWLSWSNKGGHIVAFKHVVLTR